LWLRSSCSGESSAPAARGATSAIRSKTVEQRNRTPRSFTRGSRALHLFAEEVGMVQLVEEFEVVDPVVESFVLEEPQVLHQLGLGRPLCRVSAKPGKAHVGRHEQGSGP